MPHSPPSRRRPQLTPRSAGLLQKFFAFVGAESHDKQPADVPILQIVIAQLRFQLANAQSPHDVFDEERLRSTVCTYVDLMKAGHQPSEQVVIALKRILREAGVQSERPTGEARNDSTVLWDRVVAWCIQRYYFANA